MARILPSGRVFGEASPLPSIQFAKQDHPLKTLQDAATSDLANMAVAGISRIKDEIDYSDRVHAEKSRVAAAEIEMRELEKRKRWAENVRAERAAVAAGERKPIPGFRAPPVTPDDLALEAYKEPWGLEQKYLDIDSAADPAIQKDDRVLEALRAERDAVGRAMEEQARAYLEAPSAAQGQVSPQAMQGGQYAELMGQLKGTRLEGKSPEELQALVDKVRSLPGVASGGSWRDSGIKPGDDGYKELVAVQDAIDALEIDKSVFKGEVLRDGAKAWSGHRTAKAVEMLQGYIDKMQVAKAAQPPERHGILDAKIAEFQAQIDALRPQLERRFVPRTMHDYLMVVRDTERQLLQAKTPEERSRLEKKLRDTVSGARGAVDVQPDGFMEAITLKAGREAQKLAYDEMTAIEKEFVKKMAEAAKESRAIRAEERAENRESRSQAAASRAEERHDEWREKLNKMSSGLRSRGRGESADIIDRVQNYADNYRAWKSGQVSDAEWERLTGPLSGAEPGTMASRAARLGGLRGKEVTDVRDVADNLLSRERERRTSQRARVKSDAAAARKARTANIKRDIEFAKSRLATRSTVAAWNKTLKELQGQVRGLESSVSGAKKKKKKEAEEEIAEIQRLLGFQRDMQKALDGHMDKLAEAEAVGATVDGYELVSVEEE